MAKKKKNFEEMFERLEEITNTLENGEISLETSLKLFEEGIELSHLCSEKLDKARQKVEILLRKKDGEYTEEPFEH